jgi:hypothetical protein
MSETTEAPTEQPADPAQQAPPAPASQQPPQQSRGSSAAKSVGQAAAAVVTVAAVLTRAVAYIVRARRTKAAIERMQGRYEDRAASARYLSGSMAVLEVDDPTVTAYGEVAAKGEAAAANIATVISAADALVLK